MKATPNVMPHTELLNDMLYAWLYSSFTESTAHAHCTDCFTHQTKGLLERSQLHSHFLSN